MFPRHGHKTCCITLLGLLGLQPRFGDEPLEFQVVCLQNGTAVALKGSTAMGPVMYTYVINSHTHSREALDLHRLVSQSVRVLLAREGEAARQGIPLPSEALNLLRDDGGGFQAAVRRAYHFYQVYVLNK